MKQAILKLNAIEQNASTIRPLKINFVRMKTNKFLKAVITAMIILALSPKIGWGQTVQYLDGGSLRFLNWQKQTEIPSVCFNSIISVNDLKLLPVVKCQVGTYSVLSNTMPPVQITWLHNGKTVGYTNFPFDYVKSKHIGTREQKIIDINELVKNINSEIITLDFQFAEWNTTYDNTEKYDSDNVKYYRCDEMKKMASVAYYGKLIVKKEVLKFTSNNYNVTKEEGSFALKNVVNKSNNITFNSNATLISAVSFDCVNNQIGKYNVEGVYTTTEGCVSKAKTTITLSGFCHEEIFNIGKFFVNKYNTVEYQNQEPGTIECTYQLYDLTANQYNEITYKNQYVYEHIEKDIKISDYLALKQDINKIKIVRVYKSKRSGIDFLPPNEEAEITVYKNTKYDFATLPGGICLNNSVNIKNTLNYAPPAVIITVDNTQITTALYTGTAAGIKTVKAVITDERGCQKTITKQMQVYSLPTIDLKLVPQSVCRSAGQLKLTAIRNPEGGTGSFQGLSNDLYTPPTDPGVVKQTLIYNYTDNKGCSNSAQKEIEIKDIITPTFNANSHFCKNEGIVDISNYGLPFGGKYYDKNLEKSSVLTPEADATIIGTNALDGTSTSVSFGYTSGPGRMKCFFKFDLSNIDASKEIKEFRLILKGTQTNYKKGVIGLIRSSWNESSDKSVLAHTAAPYASNLYAENITTYLQVTANNDLVLELKNWYAKWKNEVGVYGFFIDYDDITGQYDTYYSKEYNGGLSAPTLNIKYYDTFKSFNLADYQNKSAVTMAYSINSGGCVGSAEKEFNIYDISITENLKYLHNPIASDEICIDAEPKSITDMKSGITNPGVFLESPGVVGETFYPAIAGAGQHKIKYKIGPQNGFCYYTAERTVTVNPLPNVSFDFDSTAICEYQSITNLNDKVNVYDSQRGIFEGAGISGVNFNAINANKGNTNIIKYTYTDDNGCTNSKNAKIYVKEKVGIDKGMYIDVYNFKDRILLDKESPANKETGTILYSSLGTSPISTQNGNYYFQPMLADTGINKIKLTYNAQNGCQTIDTLKINVFTLPVSIGQIINTCNNDSNKIISTGYFDRSKLTEGGYTYKSSKKYVSSTPNLIINDSILRPKNVAAGEYYMKYVVTITQTDNTVKTYTSDSILLKISRNPTLPTVAIEELYCPLTPIVLTETSAISTDTVIWNNILKAKILNINLSKDSTINVVIKSIDGCYSPNKTINLITDKTDASFLVLTPEIFEKDSIKLAATMDAKTYEWTVGNKKYSGKALTIKSSEHGLITGNYNVSLKTTSQINCVDTKEKIDAITIFDYPLTILATSEGCLNDTIYKLNFARIDTSHLKINKLEYSGLGVENNVLKPIKLKTNSAKVYASLTTQENRIFKDSTIIKLNNVPNIPEVNYNPLYCNNENIALAISNINVIDTIAGYWYINNELKSIGKSLNITLTKDTFITVKNKSDKNCYSDGKNIKLVTDKTDASFTVLSPEIFEKDSIKLTAIMNAKAYEWTVGSKKYSGKYLAIKSSEQGLTAGNYNVSLKTTSDINCVDTKEINNALTVYKYPVSIITAPKACKNDTSYKLDFALIDTSNLKIQKSLYSGIGVENNVFAPIKGSIGNNKIIHTLTTTTGKVFKDTSYVTVNSNPIMPEVDVLPLYCKNSLVSLTIKNIASFDTITANWYTEDKANNLGYGKGSDSPYYSINLTQDTTIDVVLVSNNCASKANTLKLVTDKISADFYTDAANIVKGVPVQFKPVQKDATTYQWTFGPYGKSVIKEPYYIFNWDGVYDISLVATSVNSCKDTVIKKGYIEVDINDVNKSNVLLYPNPVENNLVIDNLEGGEIISIYNELGIIIANITAKENQVEIDFSNYTKGLYIVKINNNTFKINKN